MAIIEIKIVPYRSLDLAFIGCRIPFGRKDNPHSCFPAIVEVTLPPFTQSPH